MFEKFVDYLYYLLPAPLKLVGKPINQWYIFLSVIGDEYDRAQEELERALEETTVATCSDMLLPYYAQDRGIYRYPDEDEEHFRTRIAMYDEVEALGGTREAIILAASTLGYESPEHIWYPDMGEMDKWSQFLLKVTVKNEQEHPVSYSVLKNEIRKIKESTSLDNYCYCNMIESSVRMGIAVSEKNYIQMGDIEE